MCLVGQMPFQKKRFYTLVRSPVQSLWYSADGGHRTAENYTAWNLWFQVLILYPHETDNIHNYAIAHVKKII